MKIIPVVIPVMIRDNKVLFLKRASKDHGHFDNLWALPGGKIEAGEHISNAAEREANEETGLNVKFKKLKAFVSEFVLEKNESKSDTHALLYICEMKVGNGKAKSSKEGELKWFSFTEIEKEKKNIIPSDYYFVRDIFINEIGIYFHSVIHKEKDIHVLKEFTKIH